MPDTQSSKKWVETRADEPELAINNIQGNIIPGFNKDFQVFLFLKIDDVPHFRRWLGTLDITPMYEVLAFVHKRKEVEQRGEPLPEATWRNIAFSHSALLTLGALKDGDFEDKAFREGLWPRSGSLGDPIDESEGDPRTWVVGGPKNEADVVLIIASDCLTDLDSEVNRIEDTINKEKPAPSGVRIIFKQQGANLPGVLAGHEHFGFLDGISQPGVRGRISKNRRPSENDYLTQDKIGQKLLWPGEFVFGYPTKDPADAEKAKADSLNTVDRTDQKFAKDGSFLVFRRLRQDVGAFHKFLHDNARQYKLTAEELGEMFVGRRVSGVSLFSPSGQRNKKSVKESPETNAFGFQKDNKDPKGEVCPFASHIRRTNPRDDLDKDGITPRRLLRRGIPYGKPSSSTFTEPSDDTVDRGLLFIAYQTSIENQFEHIQKVANNPYFKEGNPGYDPIIGQNNSGRPRTFTFGKRQSEEVSLPRRGWVIPTGGGYFFAPSIKALNGLVHTR